MPMIDRTVAVTLAGALILLLGVLEMVRRRQLKGKYSILWLTTAVAILVLASNRAVLATLAALLGIAYPPSALVVVGFGFLSITLLHFSVVVSRLSEENTVLAQEIAILRWQVHGLESRPGHSGEQPPAGRGSPGAAS
jgi:hypothetical protein